MNTLQLSNQINFELEKFNESLLYSEISWNNIVMNSINESYLLYKEDSTETFGEKAKNIFKAIFKWFKDMFIKIKEMLKNVFHKILLNARFVSRFARSNKNEILKGFDVIKMSQKNPKISVHNWKSKDIINPKDIYDSLGKVETIGITRDIFGNINKKVSIHYFDHFDTVDMVLDSFQIQGDSNKEIIINNRNLVESSIKYAIEYENYSSKINMIFEKTAKSTKEVTFYETKIEQLASKPDDNVARKLLNNAKIALKVNKDITIRKNRTYSRAMKMITNAAMDSHKINKYCFNIQKKPELLNSY